jgi:septum formation protein
VASGDPLDKAGAYAIQHTTFRPVARIEGCYSGVMGLPLGALADALAHFGVALPADVPTVCRERTGHPCCRESDTPE